MSFRLALNINLEKLSCVKNDNVKITFSPNNKIKGLYINGSNYGDGSLDFSQFPNLEILECKNNLFTNLDLSKNLRLKQLYCTNNSLETLNLANNSELIKLDCQNNKLTSLDIPHNTKIDRLTIDNNDIEVLDLSNNPNIHDINVQQLPNLKKIILPSEGRIFYIRFNDNDYVKWKYEDGTPIEDSRVNIDNCYGQILIKQQQ